MPSKPLQAIRDFAAEGSVTEASLVARCVITAFCTFNQSILARPLRKFNQASRLSERPAARTTTTGALQVAS
jgi:hypothetical protein